MNIRPLDTGWVAITGAPKAVVKYLKYSIPIEHRYWSPELNAWCVLDKYVDACHQLGSAALSPPTPSISDDFAILHLRRDAPMVIVEAVWRKLAQLHHPDHGGDAAEYKRYNAAYQRIKKEAANGKHR